MLKPGQRLEEELLRKKKELLAGTQPNPVDGEQGESGSDTTAVEQAEEVRQATNDQRRQLYQHCHEMEGCETELGKQISAEELDSTGGGRNISQSM